MKGIESMEVEMIVDHYKMEDIPQSMTMTIAGVRRKMYLLSARWDAYSMSYVLKYKMMED